MPEFLEDPSVLTKDKLKSELVANNVTLPAGEQRKDVYVQLYLQHLTARNRPPLAAGANSKGPPDFSSDEEREPTPVLGSGTSAGRGRASVGRVRPPRGRGATETGVWGAAVRGSAAGSPPRGRRPGRGGPGEGPVASASLPVLLRRFAAGPAPGPVGNGGWAQPCEPFSKAPHIGLAPAQEVKFEHFSRFSTEVVRNRVSERSLEGSL